MLNYYLQHFQRQISGVFLRWFFCLHRGSGHHHCGDAHLQGRPASPPLPGAHLPWNTLPGGTHQRRHTSHVQVRLSLSLCPLDSCCPYELFLLIFLFSPWYVIFGGSIPLLGLFVFCQLPAHSTASENLVHKDSLGPNCIYIFVWSIWLRLKLWQSVAIESTWHELALASFINFVCFAVKPNNIIL